jgi:hypothetical protein
LSSQSSRWNVHISLVGDTLCACVPTAATVVACTMSSPWRRACLQGCPDLHWSTTAKGRHCGRTRRCAAGGRVSGGRRFFFTSRAQRHCCEGPVQDDLAFWLRPLRRAGSQSDRAPLTHPIPRPTSVQLSVLCPGREVSSITQLRTEMVSRKADRALEPSGAQSGISPHSPLTALIA